MKNCKTCKFWKQTTDWTHEGAINDGKYKALPNDKLQITLRTGWDGGYVDYIQTEEDFGCVTHKEK